jgi:hypothetical protein
MTAAPVTPSGGNGGWPAPIDFTLPGPGAAALPAGSAAQQPSWPIASAAELWAPLEPPRYVISPVLRCGSVTLLSAFGGSGKSWLAIDALVAVASGVRWLGRFPTERGRALLADFENGSYELRRRLQAVTRARGLGTPELVEAAVMPPSYLSDPSWPDIAMEIARGRALVVVDTLRAGAPGLDENDTMIRMPLDAMRRAAEATDCAWLVLVHGKKLGGFARDIDVREHTRGSSAIYDAADAVLHVTYSGEGQPLTVRQTKSRVGRAVDPFCVSIADVFGGVLMLAGDLPASGAEDPSAAFDGLCERVLMLARAHPASSGRTVAARVGGRTTRVYAALDHLAATGAVRNLGTKTAPKWVPIIHEVAEDE